MSLPRKHPIRRIVEPFASIKITITLMALAIVLIFFATWAQKDIGIWEVQKHYFYTWITYFDFTTGGKINPETGLFEPVRTVFRLYMPGGYIVGGGLLISLSLAPIVHFKLAKRKMGVHLIHLGIVILLIGELITGLRAQESQMSIREGQTTNYAETVFPFVSELALINVTEPDHHRVYAIDESKLEPGYQFTCPDWPIRIEVVEFYVNAAVTGRNAGAEGFRAPNADSGIAPNIAFRELPYNKKQNNKPPNRPAAIIKISDVSTPKEKTIGTWFCSSGVDVPQRLSLGNRIFEIQLRPRRTYFPFSVTLNDFQFNRYPGSNIPKDFSSYVTLTEEDNRQGRDVRIWMNHPFRTDGYTLFQQSYAPDETGTVLQIVRNPVWTFPYVGCAVVTLGMLIQFGISLYAHTEKRKRQATA